MKIGSAGMLAAVCVLSFACTKKEEEPQADERYVAPQPSQVEIMKDQAVEKVEAVKEQATQQMEAVKEQAVAKVEEYKEVVISATRPLAEVDEEATNLTLEQLKAAAMKYKDAIEAKTAELEPLVNKLKELPMSQKLSAEGLQIKDEIAGVQESVEALKARYDVYVNRLKGMGADVTTFLK